MHCGNHHELSSKSLLDSLMMWDFAPVDMQDLALILPSIPLTSGFVPQFALDLSAAGMPNTTTTVSSVQDGLLNGTVRCHGLEHFAPDAASACLQGSASRTCKSPFLSVLCRCMTNSNNIALSAQMRGMCGSSSHSNVCQLSDDHIHGCSVPADIGTSAQQEWQALPLPRRVPLPLPC